MQVKLSVVIITYNEERNIERCILSVKEVADEILVVDSFSTDQTKVICEKHQVRFIENAFEGHIEQKNFAKEQASYDYILSLDADEALDETLKEEVKKLQLKNTDPKISNHIIRQNEINSHMIRAFASLIEDNKLNSKIRRSGFGMFF